MLRLVESREIDAFLARRRRVEASVEDVVGPILSDVRQRGDAALIQWGTKLDDLKGQPLKVCESELVAANLAGELEAAVEEAIGHVRTFASFQMPEEKEIEICPGVVAGQMIRPLERIGAYVPGGIYPLPSTLIMTVVPAQVAGVREICVASPRPAAVTLAVANRLGIRDFLRVGGAQAIAAFAFGTQSVKKVDRIVGPGNVYVAAAKRLLAGETPIDCVAGPSEVVIVACEHATWVAADMLAQAEHSATASGILVTTSKVFAQEVVSELERLLLTLPTADLARESLQTNGAALVADSMSHAMDAVHQIAPEHLCIHDPALLSLVQNAGSVFIGPLSAESFGDYATGPNHVLPTGGTARSRGGLSVLDFVKVITYQRLTDVGARTLTPSVATLARAEGLEAHARAAEVRL